MAKIILQKGKEKKIQNFYPNVFKDEVKSIIGKIENVGGDTKNNY